MLAETAAEREDEEEVLLALAEELSNVIGLVGGQDRAHCILVPLETLCTTEDAAVRDKVGTGFFWQSNFLVSVSQLSVPCVR